MDELSWLRGVMTPLITPMVGEEIDFRTLARLADRQAVEGVHGVVVNGTSGEPSTLTLAERTRAVATVADEVGDRLPVLAATGSQSLMETLVLSREAVMAGAKAILVVTPYYVVPPQRGLVEYYVRVAAEVDVPVLIYHIPRRAAVSIDVETLGLIVERAPNVIGIKHSARDLAYVTDVLTALQDFRVFVGVEDLSFPMLAIGAIGLINAVGNVLPQELVALYDAVQRSDLEAARELHDRLFEINESVFWDTNPIAIKYLMRRAGHIERNDHRLPMMPATPELATRLDAVLQRLDARLETA